MGTWSHIESIDKRDAIRAAVPPPIPPRPCSGQKYVNAQKDYKNWEGQHVDGWDGHWAPCQNNAVQFVQEVAYCAHHLPAEWLVVAQKRKVLWVELSLDIWAQVCAEIPGPESVA